jgi:hypothetical protein
MLKGKNTYLKKLSSGDTQSRLHELEVHQIELENFTFDKSRSIIEVNLTRAKKLGIERANLIQGFPENTEVQVLDLLLQRS